MSFLAEVPFSHVKATTKKGYAMSDENTHAPNDSLGDFQLSGQCWFCIHHFTGTWGACSAFPNGIPIDVYVGQRSHKTPIEGDNGIQFRLINDRTVQ